MRHDNVSRREWLGGVSAAAAVGVTAGARTPATAAGGEARDSFRYSLNTSTIRGQKLTLVQEVEVAARAGYQGFEPWLPKMKEYVAGGGSLKDLGKRIRDRGLIVPSSIGFAAWVVDDDARRKKGLEEARRDMDMVRQIGGQRIAAPPVGATDQADLDLHKAAERYRALLDIGAKIGVIPQVEVWGFSKSLNRLGETMQVAMASGHPDACVLADVYHLYKGGSGFNTLKLASGFALHVFHMNDYPAMPDRARITDAHRVYPGDGVAPLVSMLRDLHNAGFRGMLSLELFNEGYWKQDALEVARTGLAKMKALTRKALAMR